MWGYKGFGTARWAANSDANINAVNYSPVTVTIVYEGGPAPAVSGINPIVVFQVVRETLRDTDTDLVVNALVRETLRSSTEGETAIQVRALVRETLRASTFGETGVDVRALVRETLRSSGLKSGRRRQLILPNVGPWQ